MRKKQPWHYKEVLENLYIEQGLTVRQIGQIFGITPSNVMYWLKKFEIQGREFDIGGLNKGKKLTEDQKKNLSEFAKKRFSNPENHPMHGRRHTEESKQKMSETKKRKRQERLGRKI